MSKINPDLVGYPPKFYWVLMVVVTLLAGCNPPADAQTDDNPSGGSGTLKAINHTYWAINHFSVDGQSGIDIIGPWQGGGGGCCYGVPSTWTPGLTVKVEWETGAGDMDGFPGFGDDKKLLAWDRKMKAMNREHSTTIPVTDYSGQKTCGITVHFLPCDRVKVTTSCYSYGDPHYPINDPMQMEEPTVCPK